MMREDEIERRVRESAVPLPDPRYWGNKFWFTMHTVAYFYPENPTPAEQQAAEQFYSSLSLLLPCPACGAHYATLIQLTPPRVGSRMELLEWTIDIHNEVNARLGKRTITLEEYLMHNRQLERPSMLPYQPILLAIAAGCIVLAIVRLNYFARYRTMTAATAYT